MVSREHRVVLAFGTVALAIAYGGLVLTPIDDIVFIGVPMFVGVVAPQLLSDYLDNRTVE